MSSHPLKPNRERWSSLLGWESVLEADRRIGGVIENTCAESRILGDGISYPHFCVVSPATVCGGRTCFSSRQCAVTWFSTSIFCAIVDFMSIDP